MLMGMSVGWERTELPEKGPRFGEAREGSVLNTCRDLREGGAWRCVREGRRGWMATRSQF